nr:glucarate dehydratase family protein [Gulosibacter faecalis]
MEQIRRMRVSADQLTDSTEAAIAEIVITPVAFHDAPLLNSVGVHEPFALRAIVEVITAGGIVGLGETYGDAGHIQRLALAAESLLGVDVANTNELRRRVQAALANDAIVGGHGMSGMVTTTAADDRVLSPFEVAALDIRGKLAGVSVSEFLGGRVRERVELSGYLFYKWGGHIDEAGNPGPDDEWGPALDPEGIVEQARRLIDKYGFRALKLKGGVFEPDVEVATILALREAFPDVLLRVDPNGAWNVESSVKVADALEGVIEYLEDPTVGLEGLAEVRRRTSIPLATNMYVVSFDHVRPAIEQGAVDIVLSDHHFWGGFKRSQLLAGICETVGWGLSMHSNSHLGISFAAMIHLAAATPNLNFACDTHWPWKRPDEDVIVGDVFTISGGTVNVPDGPGLGVELDRDRLAQLHEQYLAAGQSQRDDTTYMRRVRPDFSPEIPKW